MDARNVTEVEIVRPEIRRGRFRAVVFDFDGTLSLIREGWPQLMIGMMVEVLQATGSGEDRRALAEHIEAFVMRLNGRPTIHQMIHLAEEVRQRGGEPLPPRAYEDRFLAALGERIATRTAALTDGRATPAEWAVPGAHAMLQQLQERGLDLYLASGTDLVDVRREAALLRLAPFFGQHIYGPVHAGDGFSKRAVIERVVADTGLHGSELLGFGDGPVEIEEIKRAGGVAVAVASDEIKRQGIHPGKRARLIEAGADIIIADYRQRDPLLQFLLG